MRKKQTRRPLSGKFGRKNFFLCVFCSEFGHSLSSCAAESSARWQPLPFPRLLRQWQCHLQENLLNSSSYILNISNLKNLGVLRVEMSLRPSQSLTMLDV
jgi:hypothetical protein